MSTQNQREREIQIRNNLTESAFCFLERAIAEFKTDDLKYSVIHFCSAAELFLKAKVMQKGWEQILIQDEDQSPPFSFTGFCEGKLRTIGMKKCCQKLKDHISSSDKKVFGKLAKQRNQIVHFYHPTITINKEEVVKEYLCGLFVLQRLLTLSGNERIKLIFKKDLLYNRCLEAMRDRKKQFIHMLEKKGTPFTTCPACESDSFQCEWAEESKVEHVCLICGLEIVDDTIGHCYECDSVSSVAQIGSTYYCMNCHQFYPSMSECSHCGHSNTSLPKNSDDNGDASAWLGCVACDGLEAK